MLRFSPLSCLAALCTFFVFGALPHCQWRLFVCWRVCFCLYSKQVLLYNNSSPGNFNSALVVSPFVARVLFNQLAAALRPKVCRCRYGHTTAYPTATCRLPVGLACNVPTFKCSLPEIVNQTSSRQIFPQRLFVNVRSACLILFACGRASGSAKVKVTKQSQSIFYDVAEWQ